MLSKLGRSRYNSTWIWIRLMKVEGSMLEHVGNWNRWIRIGEKERRGLVENLG